MPDQPFTSKWPVAPSRISLHIALALVLFAAALLLTGCGSRP
jgi:hypothetical protein